MITKLYAALLLLACLGCSNGRSDLGQVRGRVTFAGKPLAGATVVFAKDGAERWSFGETNEQGEFVITTFLPGDGAFLGVNKVSVSQPKPPVSSGAEVVAVSPGPEAATPPAEPIVPLRYNDLASTDLTVEVQPGANEPVELKLTP